MCWNAVQLEFDRIQIPNTGCAVGDFRPERCPNSEKQSYQTMVNKVQMHAFNATH